MEQWLPDECHVDFSAGCNARCVMCSVYQDTPVPVLADERFLDRIVKTASWVKNFRVGCSSESTLHPKAVETLDRLKRRGARVQILTNGKLLPKFALRFCQINLDVIRISLDSLNGAVLSRKRRGIRLESILKGISIINEFKRKNSTKVPRLGLAVTVMRDTLAELPLMIEFCAENNICLLDYGYLFLQRPDYELMSMSPYFCPKQTNEALAKAEELAMRYSIQFHPKYFGRSELIYTGDVQAYPFLADVNFSFPSAESCAVHRRDAWIYCDGSVYLCNRVRIGNIVTQSWDEIANNPNSRNIPFLEGEAKRRFCEQCTTCYIRHPDRICGHFGQDIIRRFGESTLKELSAKEPTVEELLQFFSSYPVRS